MLFVAHQPMSAFIDKIISSLSFIKCSTLKISLFCENSMYDAYLHPLHELFSSSQMIYSSQ